MGCDIHMVIEVREVWPNFPDWNEVHICEFEPRDYHVFGFIAGVRRDGPPIVEPRGLPKDLSYYLAHVYEEGSLLGDHTYTWLTPNEYKQAIQLAKNQGEIYPWWDALLGALEAYEKVWGEGNVRLIIGFDN